MTFNLNKKEFLIKNKFKNKNGILGLCTVFTKLFRGNGMKKFLKNQFT